MARTRSGTLAAALLVAALSVGALAPNLAAQGGGSRGRGTPAGASGRNPGARSDTVKPPLVVPGRSMIATKLGIVASSQPLAAAAGAQILAAGGNAVDAAIAANAVTGVAEPMMNGIGGDLFAIVYEAKTGKVYGLNASGWAASGVTADVVASHAPNGRMPQRGVWTVNVPGAVAGWDALRTRFGTKPFSELLAPAIYYASHGFPVGEVTSRLWAGADRQENAAFRATYLVDGHAPHAGQEFRNADLAASLERIARGGARGFYEGPTAHAILSTIAAEGGTMVASDLTGFRPEWVNTLTTNYRGWTVHELPPNSQGMAALMMLNIMSRFPLGEYGFLSTKTMHTEIEAKKLAYADLLRYIGDPKFSKLPVEQLMSAATADARAKMIDPARANCHVEPVAMADLEKGESETIYLSAIDKDGNIVSLIQSNYSAFGSGIVAPGTGFVLHNRGALFTLEKGQPNTIEPHKRPLHTIIPAFMEKGDVKIGFGIMGGWNQSQAHAQFVSNIADFGMNIQEALEAPRFTKRTFDGCDLEAETKVPAGVIAELRAMGHDIRVTDGRFTDSYGYGQAVMSNGAGIHFGASEPRHDGAAIPQAAPVPR
ncbi:MAG TPA: gamma-glutamyltransferase [Gemmatimonadaceae bacterium]|nr:gamma-glutamyltransferase [Gemmatimonadaceae bacterium]